VGNFWGSPAPECRTDAKGYPALAGLQPLELGILERPENTAETHNAHQPESREDGDLLDVPMAHIQRLSTAIRRKEADTVADTD